MTSKLTDARLRKLLAKHKLKTASFANWAELRDSAPDLAAEVLRLRKIERAAKTLTALAVEWEAAHGFDNVTTDDDFDHAFWLQRQDEAEAALYKAVNEARKTKVR